MMWFEREYSWFTETLLSLLHYWNKFENEVCALKHLTLRWPEPGALAYNMFQGKQKDIMESKSPQSATDIFFFFFNWNEITGEGLKKKKQISTGFVNYIALKNVFIY